jgi:hypothetical protein
MSVYVDSLMSCIPNRNWRWKTVAHLFADSDDELLEFGRKIGLKASWLQRKSVIHFDITPSMRVRAVSLGAIEVGREFVAERVRASRMKDNQAVKAEDS